MPPKLPTIQNRKPKVKAKPSGGMTITVGKPMAGMKMKNC